MSALRWSAVLAAALALLLAAVLVVAYLRSIGRAYERIAGRSDVVASPLGDIEFGQGGAGPDVLVVHGSGGGFDQGELIARAVLGEDFHWIAPSRFGYLRSTFRDGATFADQAHAYRHLLDHLGIERVAVVALSHGGPSALLFAALYPERVSALVLVSCGVASAPSDPGQALANRKGDALVTIFSHDPLYWAFSTAFRTQLIGLMGADDEVLAGLAPAQRQLVDDVIAFMNPVAPRAAGVAFDNRAALPNERIAAIRAPTLIVHATDDGLQLYRNAEFAAATIPRARLVRFEHGGHLLLAVEQAEVRAQVQAFIRANGRS
jgi:2-hydroxy-6-oxonona-2,4-dienedioate hydrolase